MMPSSHPVRLAFRASIRHALGPCQIVEFADGLLAIDAEGRIAACDTYEKLASRLPKDCILKDYRGSWIVPGFVDCHVHLPQLDCRNKNGLTLLDWLKKYIYPLEEKFSNPKVALDVSRRFYDELLSHGIITAAIYSVVHYEATDIAFQIALEKGVRAIIGQALNDQNAPEALLRPAKQLCNETEKLISKWHGREKRLFVALTPRFAPSCSKRLIQDCGRMASEAKTYFQTHLAETVDEVEWAKESHHFKNYTGFYADCGCLNSRSLLAHCIYLKDEEWRVLSDTQSAVAHCPTSNVFLKSGTMSVERAERYGLRLGFGTDVGAGPTFSMREVADCAIEVHRGKMTLEKAFYLATLGGAEALSLSNQIGNFVEGKWADFSLFNNPQFKGTAQRVFVKGQVIYSSSTNL